MPGYADELAFACKLVREVGKLLRDNLHVGHNSDLKADGSHVTEIDKDVNRRIIEAVKKQYPNDDILGEEESNLSEADERVWVCDPLDGIFPFKCGVPVSVVMIGLLEENRPVVSVVYNPYVD